MVNQVGVPYVLLEGPDQNEDGRPMTLNEDVSRRCFPTASTGQMDSPCHKRWSETQFRVFPLPGAMNSRVVQTKDVDYFSDAANVRRSDTNDSEQRKGNSFLRLPGYHVLASMCHAMITVHSFLFLMYQRPDARRYLRNVRKRADIQKATRETTIAPIKPEGTIWACCCSNECLFDSLQVAYNQGHFNPSEFSLGTAYSEVIFSRAFGDKTLFLFKFGCVVGWDFTLEERVKILNLLRPFQRTPALDKHENDEMSYVWSEKQGIRQDTIHLVSDNIFEKLAYSYAFAQCVKLGFFETNVDETIERTRAIPESLAQTGKVNSTREDISRRIGELFTSRFYINLHTDILDTPDIFWEFDEYADHYSSCRRYLEIPKRVQILNQRLDIIKDLYDMLNDELTIQHGHRLEWIVIYLICVEVAIELIWNIIIKDILKLV